jgi:hypothetical protein
MPRSGFNWGGIVQDKEKPKTKAKKIFWIVFKLFAVFILLLILMYNTIPGMIRYRPKAYCQQAEFDANNIAATIADYFGNPLHTTLPTISGDSEYLGYTLNSRDGQNIAWVTGDPESTITIVVQDGSGKCPEAYQEQVPEWDSSKYTKILEP